MQDEFDSEEPREVAVRLLCEFYEARTGWGELTPELANSVMSAQRQAFHRIARGRRGDNKLMAWDMLNQFSTYISIRMKPDKTINDLENALFNDSGLQ